MKKIRHIFGQKLLGKKVKNLPLTLNEDISPILIIGSGRSGNTLLRRILTGGPELYIPPETYVLGRIVKQHQNMFSLSWPEQCNLVLGTFSNTEDFETFPTPYLHQLYINLLSVPEQSRSLAAIVARFYEYMMHRSKPTAVRWGDKTPLNSKSLNEIDKMFPKAKYVHIIRNGYDVVNSYLKMGRYSSAVDAANRWVTSVHQCHVFAENNREKVMEIKYEELCEKPEEIAQSVCGFLNLTFVDEMVSSSGDLEQLGDVNARAHYSNVSNPINVSSIGEGMRALKPEILAQVRPLMLPTLTAFGYSA